MRRSCAGAQPDPPTARRLKARLEPTLGMDCEEVQAVMLAQEGLRAMPSSSEALHPTASSLATLNLACQVAPEPLGGLVGQEAPLVLLVIPTRPCPASARRKTVILHAADAAHRTKDPTHKPLARLGPKGPRVRAHRMGQMGPSQLLTLRRFLRLQLQRLLRFALGCGCWTTTTTMSCSLLARKL